MSDPIFRLPPYELKEVFTQLSQTVDWGHAVIGVPRGWVRNRGKGARIAILDTGVQNNHPDLNGQVIAAKDFTGSGSGHDDRAGHGTHVAGVVAAIDNDTGVVGVAPECNLIIGKVLGDDGSGGDSGIAAGIDWAIAQKAHVISMSLGSSSPSNRIHDAVKRAAAAGIVIIAAAGNEGPNQGSVGYPGAFPECVCVGAFDANGKIANFSSRGSQLDVAGPGVNVLSCIPGSKYGRMSGTSMATPYVAGVAALVVGACLAFSRPTPTSAEFKAMLKGASVDAGATGRDPAFGWGLIDPQFLIDNLGPKPPPVAKP